MRRATPHYGWFVVGMGCLVVFASLGLGRFAYSTVLPDMQSALGMDNTQAGLLATANLVGYLLLSALGGALASRYGPRIVITFGLLIAGIGMVLTGVADSYRAVLVWRTVTGLGSGASNVPVMGLLAAWAASRRRGLATGIGVAGSSIALIALGPLVPYLLTRCGPDGWRRAWLIFGGVSILIAAGAWLVLRNRPSELGVAALGSTGETRVDDGPVAKRHWWQMYTSGRVWHLGLVYAAFGFSYIIYLTFFFKRLVDGAGYTKEAAGTLFMVMGWCSLLCGVLWGALSDRIGRRRTLVMVYVLHAAAFSLFAITTSHTGFVLSAVLFGLSAWSIPAIMAAAAGDVVGPRLAPAALGFVTLFFGVGQALGPGIAGAMADASQSLAPAYLLAAGVAGLGALGSVFLDQGIVRRASDASSSSE